MLYTAPQIFQIQAKISTVWLVFPDYLPVSYDYGFMNTWQLSEGERHNLSHRENLVKITINDVFMTKGDEKNRGKWKIGIIENIFIGKDSNTVRSIKTHCWEECY